MLSVNTYLATHTGVNLIDCIEMNSRIIIALFILDYYDKISLYYVYRAQLLKTLSSI